MSSQRRRVLEGDGGMTTITNDGVYIEGLDGKFYTVGNWKGGEDANSVVVASGDVKFKMALDWQLHRYRISINEDDPLENYMTAIESSSKAEVDYNGAGNTAKILQMQSSKSYAAGWCNAFVFPDKKTKGYLPSLGQLNIAYKNKEAVDAAISKCGGVAMSTSYYWSSTFWGINGDLRACWYLNWSSGMEYFSTITNIRYVLPFADVDSPCKTSIGYTLHYFSPPPLFLHVIF